MGGSIISATQVSPRDPNAEELFWARCHNFACMKDSEKEASLKGTLTEKEMRKAEEVEINLNRS